MLLLYCCCCCYCYCFCYYYCCYYYYYYAGPDELYRTDTIPFIAVRLWTTAEKLGDTVEFCSILNKAP